MQTIICPECGMQYQRLQKRINQVIRKSGKWVCKKCSTVKRNVSRSKPIGSTRISNKGYIFEKTSVGYVQQHRLVVEKAIGRPLLPSELVHHIDGNKKNNAAINLKIDNWGEHTTSHHTGAKRSEEAKRNIRNAVLYRKGTRLNTRLVKIIKARNMEGETQRSIARDLCVSPMTISRVIRGETWNGPIE